MLEHDKYWQASLHHMFEILRPGGLLVMTCAGQGRAPHGIAECKPEWSPLTMQADWRYYRNMDVADILTIYRSPFTMFEQCCIDIQSDDLRFWGLKKA
jgi:hypothetical protein